MQTSSIPNANTSAIDRITLVLKVDGMSCADCVQTVEQRLLQQPGVIAAAVDLATALATVECESGVDPAALTRRLTEAGFPSSLQQSKVAASSGRSPVSWTVMGFHILAVVFNLCLNAQVLTVGLAYFYNSEWWQVHVALVRGYSVLSLILLVWVYRVPFPRRVRRLTASLPVLLGLQFLSIRWQTPIPLAVLHPLIGFTLFSVSTTLVHRVWRFISPKPEDDMTLRT